MRRSAVSLGCAASLFVALGCASDLDDLAVQAPAAQVGPTTTGVVRAPASGSGPVTLVTPDWDLCAVLARRAGSDAPRGDRITWQSLLCELVDLDRFTRPEAPYARKMASSRDPASREEGAEGWFANEDYGHFLRDEGAEHVLLETHGSGVITRFWSANPRGVLRFYLDDRSVPAIELDLATLFRGGAPAPFRAPFAYVSGRGSNLIFPIPFASYARVTVSAPSPKLFYQVDYRSYPEGTAIEPYSAQGAAALAPLAREVAKLLANPGDPSVLPALHEQTLTFGEASPEQRVQIGPATIRELTLRGFDPGEQWLRTTRLIMTVDGVRTIDAPVGSLFTAELGAQPHASLVASVSREALTLRWPMPVRGALSVRLESNGGRLGTPTLTLRHSAGVPADARLFHARWSGLRVFDTAAPVDWTLVALQGRGVYVGTVLNIANPAIEWWGEGDEKVFVDGERVPSLFGTGTEDYFGYAWCSSESFATPFNGQPRVDGAINWGRASMYRWHVLDAIPFASSLRFNLEVQHWRTGAEAVDLTEDALSVWYATPDTTVVQGRALALSDFQLPRIDTARPFWPLPYDCQFLSLLP